MVIGKIASKFSLEKFDGNQLKSKLISDYAVWDSTSGKWTAYNYYVREMFNGKEVIKRGEKITLLPS